MKFFTLKKFTIEELDRFTWFVNQCKPQEHIHILLNSEWWDSTVWDAITTIINESPEQFSITVMMAISAAFVLLLDIKSSIDLLNNWFCLAHKGGWKVFVRDWCTVEDEYSAFQRQQLAAAIEDVSYLTEKEKKLFNDWKDVYLNKRRTWEILTYKWRTYSKEDDTYEFISE